MAWHGSDVTRHENTLGVGGEPEYFRIWSRVGYNAFGRTPIQLTLAPEEASSYSRMQIGVSLESDSQTRVF